MKALITAGAFLITVSMLAHSPSSLAVSRVHNGAGSVLLFPFFTTENGHDTYINVSALGVRDSGDTFFTPVLKVRFLDAETAEVVNSFNVYPDQSENWQAAITFDDNQQRVELRLQEGSCMLDESLNILVGGDDAPINADVGMVEVYLMGLYVPDALGSDATSRCDAAAARWQVGGEWAVDALADIVGFDSERVRTQALLLGEAWLVNVREGYSASYVPVTLNKVFSVPVHEHPEHLSPNLSEADPVITIDGEDVVPGSGEGIDAVAMAIALGEGSEMINDVVTSDTVQARTDWVISYPLDTYKNYKPFAIVDGDTTVYCEGFGDSAPTAGQPTVRAFLETSGSGVWSWGLGQTNYYSSPFSPVPVLPQTATLCRPVNVVAFGGREPILVNPSSALLAEEPSPLAPSPYEGDSLTLRWIPYPGEYPEGSGIRRPVVGFRLTTFLNGTLNQGNTLANYAVLRSHQTR